MNTQRLSEAEVRQRLGQLSGWALSGDRLHKEYRFDSFVDCFAFMTKVALFAEAMQHHPEWFNVYNRLVVDLRTHDADGISERDFELARKMDGCT